MITGDRLLERGPIREIRKRINQLQDEIKALRISEGVNYRVKHTACGQILIFNTETGEVEPSDLEIRRFQVTEVKPKYLNCRQIDPDGLAFETYKTIKVQRPYCTWLNDDSVTVSGWTVSTTDTVKNVARSLTKVDEGLTYILSQKIYPTWETSEDPGVGDYIFAAKNIEGWYFYDDTVSPQELVEWLDLNIDGRHWAFDGLKKVAVCVDGMTKYMFVIGSELGANA